MARLFVIAVMKFEKSFIVRYFVDRSDPTDRQLEIGKAHPVIERLELKLRIRRTRAFTLIELLVVIAIIAILAALLMPAMQNALHRARSVACQSNLHQVSLGALQYASDHDAVMPAYWDNPTHDPDGPAIHWQFTIGVNYLNENPGTYSVTEAILRSPLHCPADMKVPRGRVRGKPTRCVAINGTMNPKTYFNGRSWPQSSGATLANLSLIERPPDMCMGGDGAGAIFSNEWGNGARYYDINMGNLFMFTRHLGGLNVVMMDGHTVWLSPQDFGRIVSEQGYEGVFFDWGDLNQ